ncbi:unnamed protein product [Phytophthora fragariaefolia]|uniref:Unnamed protein product n=1 Tax=Phytophthora fragariaefolia TaxID=1490495 RepID=A0A9W6XXQ8_9STRA|nr:unnamed protein product [Phytophthora fragariaefolia]
MAKAPSATSHGLAPTARQSESRRPSFGGGHGFKEEKKEKKKEEKRVGELRGRAVCSWQGSWETAWEAPEGRHYTAVNGLGDVRIRPTSLPSPSVGVVGVEWEANEFLPVCYTTSAPCEVARIPRVTERVGAGGPAPD